MALLVLIVQLAVVLRADAGTTGVEALGSNDAQEGAPRLAIDADTTNGICGAVIDSTIRVREREPFRVAVCLLDSPSSPDGFALSVRYDDTIIVAPEDACNSPCSDSNPDVNDGDTTFTIPALSTDSGWNCSAGEIKPTGNLKRVPIGGNATPGPGVGQGNAFSGPCLNLGGANTLPSNAPLALVRFEPLRNGSVTLSLGPESALSASSGDEIGQPLGSCNVDSPFALTCAGATVIVQLADEDNSSAWPFIIVIVGLGLAGALALVAFIAKVRPTRLLSRSRKQNL